MLDHIVRPLLVLKAGLHRVESVRVRRFIMRLVQLNLEVLNGQGLLRRHRDFFPDTRHLAGLLAKSVLFRILSFTVVVL